MRRSFSLFLSLLLTTLLPFTSAIRIIESKSLNPCQDNSKFSATLFNVAFTPDNKTLALTMNGVASISGNVTIELTVFAYGYQAIKQKLNPCAQKELKGLCPMNAGPIDLHSETQLSADIVKKVPSIAYTIPDLDGKVRLTFNKSDTGEPLACVEADISNGQSVYQIAVGWVTAIIAGLGLITSAIASGLGHSNTAAHVAANALSLFAFFQSQAFFGMTAVDLPPIVGSWTQNFQWSMGIIHIGFIQDLATWYQRATGGKASVLLSSLSTTSVEIQKRSLSLLHKMYSRALESRSNSENQDQSTDRVVLRGIQRVGFRAKIEPTNIFMTGYIFLVVFIMLVVLGVVVFKFVCESLVKSGKMKGEKFVDFRNGWTTVLKGILYRIILIGFPQMTVLCFWELTRRDSIAIVILAILTWLAMVGILAWASMKVIRIAQRSITMHKNPAYILYSDPSSLNKWGFLYVQFKATAYYFIVPILGYVLVKGMFIGLAQGSGVAQAIALVLIEGGLLVAICVLRPYMDKKTNAFNIAICSINFLSAIFLLVFSNVFNQPAIVTGVMGVIFFVYNAAFALILLIMVLASSIMALSSKNPDTRYQPMRDDRGSFIKSQTNLNTELDALGATARGENKTGQGSRTAIDDDDASFVSAQPNYASKEMGSVTTSAAARSGDFSNPPRSPNVNSPFIPHHDARMAAAAAYNDRSNSNSPAPYRPHPQQQFSRSGSSHSHQSHRGPRPGPGGPGGPGGYRQQNNSSPWQRGAGYDH